MLTAFCVMLFFVIVWIGVTRLHECRKPRKNKNKEPKDDEELQLHDLKTKPGVEFDKFDRD